MISAGSPGEHARRRVWRRDFTWRTLDRWDCDRRVIGKAEWTQGEANSRFIVTSLKPCEVAGPYLCEAICCARGKMEKPDQGMPARPVPRPHLGRHHARQPDPPLVRLLGLCPALRAPPDRSRPYPVRLSHLRHDPPQIAQDRRLGHPQSPAYPHRHGLSPSRAIRIRHRPRLASKRLRLTRPGHRSLHAERFGVDHAADARGVVPRRAEFPEPVYQINRFAIRGVELQYGIARGG